MEENDYLDDEELTEDEIVEIFIELMRNGEGAVSLSNPFEPSKVKISEEIIDYCLNGEDLIIETELNVPFITSAGIGIEGKKITVTKPKVFTSLLHYCDNIEFYSKTDGSVNISLAFSNIAVMIGGNNNE